MKLTYIFHSCFVLDTDTCVLVFDYWLDPAEVLTKVMAAAGGKPIYVFASHFHEDHFTKRIFNWRDKYKHCTITYILSKDILKHRRASKEDADVWMVKGSTWSDENIAVRATGSNDSGVSWIIDVDGKRVFHAGDLCNWYARFLSDSHPENEIYSEEMDRYINPVHEERLFLGELKDIRKVADSFDVVMFPVDGRIGNGYTLGGRQFVERFGVGLFVPMHFVASGFKSAWRMEPFCAERSIPFWSISCEGDVIDVR